MKTEILKLLKESDGHLSGQQLCDRFSVSRTAVWKVMEQLKKEGYQIEAVRNRGYHLIKSPDVMSKSELKSLMKTKWAGREIEYYDEIGSTNNEAKAGGEEGRINGTLYVADRQTAGKGRRGKSWESPSGVSISFSLLLRPQLQPSRASMLTLVMGLSVAEALEKISGEEVAIKWPNDIVLNRKKAVGILTEMSTEIDSISYVVIGVGININQEEFPEDLRSIATSLKIETGKNWKRAEIIAEILRRFEDHYEKFLQTEDLSLLKDAYERILINRGKNVRVLDPKGSYEAVADGINDSGELLVTLPDGQQKEVYAGEVSVRGLYGYV